MMEVTRIILENEMDLILAHKQSMKLAELTGLSLSAQTSFATAVSEISRGSANAENPTILILGVSGMKSVRNIFASLTNNTKISRKAFDEGIKHAERLVSSISTNDENGQYTVSLLQRLPPTTSINDEIIERWRIHLNSDPAVSPYEEIKRKNKQLLALADNLKESEDKYRVLADSLPIMIFSVDPTGAMTYANNWLTDYAVSTPGEINNSGWKTFLHADDYEKLFPAAGLTVLSDSFSSEVRLRNGTTGEYRWHNGMSVPIKKHDGAIGHWNTFLVDIHAQKVIEETLNANSVLIQIQKQLEDKIAQLDQSNKLLEQFAYITSHDMQEPLRKISFYSDFVLSKYSDKLPEDGLRYLNSLAKAAQRMKLLVQDVLAYSTVNKEVDDFIELDEVISETLTDFDLAIKEKSAMISVGALPIVYGNKRQMKQIFDNLLSNSLKFTLPGTSPVISITAYRQNDESVIAFSDNGIGFDDQYAFKMFELFQRLHSKDAYLGTGIGLAICKKIMDLHNGSITVKSQPGKGTTFFISIPDNKVSTK